MKSKLISLLFAMPFFGVGVWMTWSVGSNVIDALAMQSWDPVQATLEQAGYERHSGDDSDTFEAYARYTYEYRGRQYTGTRVAITSGADNIGDYQTDLGDQLSGHMRRGQNVTVYVNPNDPSAAVIDRSLRWGLIGFKSVFLLVFGGIGLGLIVYVLRAPKDKDADSPEFQDKPWFANDEWQSSAIRSNSKNTMYFSWGFAAIWNLVSAPLPFLIYREVVAKDNMPALLGLLFPLVGIWLLAWAIIRTLEWRRFGVAPVVMDPFPGSIGGHVGGTVDINMPFDGAGKFSVTLTSIHSYMSGSGKNRSRKESAKWQDAQIAHMTAGATGSRLSFRFDVPADLQESDAVKDGGNYYLWRLNIKADLDGVDFDRDYEIPVYPTALHSSKLSERSIGQAKSAQQQVNLDEIGKLVNVTRNASGISLHFPMGRNPGLGLGGVLFGGVFLASGWFLTVHEGLWFMGSVFAAVGGLIFLSSLYLVFNSLDVFQESGGIRSVRRILGVKVRERTMRAADFVNFSKRSTSTSQTGSRHVMHYSVTAVDRSGNTMVVGEGFRGAGQADAAAEFIGSKFGLTRQDSPSGRENRLRTTDDSNYLAAD